VNQSLLNAGLPSASAGFGSAEYRFDCADLPDTFYVTSFEGTEALNEPYRWTIGLRPEHHETESGQLLGRDVTLVITVRGMERSLRGVVDRITVAHDAHGVQVCSVIVVPALSALSRTTATRIFEDKTALDIVEEVLGEGLGPYRRTFDAESVDRARLVTRNYCVQYRESNLAFVHRMLEEEGIGYYFDHESEPEKLVLFDHTRGLARATTPGGNAVQFGSESGVESAWDQLVWFPETHSPSATKVTIRDYDWRLASRGVLEAQGDVGGADRRREHEVYEHGVGRHHVIHEETSSLLSMMDALLTSLVGGNLPIPVADRIFGLKGSILERFSTSNTDDRARIRREWHERDARVLDGISFFTGLSAGSAFEVAGHPKIGTDGEYYVTRITHSNGPPVNDAAGPEVTEHARRLGYHNRIQCLPLATQWRPDTVTPKPRIDGVQTATVTGPPGMDVYTDPHGRIKVRFPWDRGEHDASGHYTCWLRVSQAWAGQTAPGFLFIPRVGMEVLVSFLDGDPDRPVCIGCVYNGENATPALLPAQATKSIIRTRSIPMGTGYNELSFEDAMGMERVHIRAERDLSELVQNDHEVRVHGDEEISIGGAQAEHVRLDQSVRVGRHYRRSVGGSTSETTGADLTRAVRGTVRDVVDHGYHLRVGIGMSTEVLTGEWSTYAKQGLTIAQGPNHYLRMTDRENGPDKAKVGITMASEGASAHLAKDKLEIDVGSSKIHVFPDRIELKVGESQIVITADKIQANGKQLPLGSS
jgi:type VI secretion system secreted protein VgrG